MTRRGLFAALAGLFLVRPEVQSQQEVLITVTCDASKKVAEAWQRVRESIERQLAERERGLATIEQAIERRRKGKGEA